jgi:YD repeat-containing protein
METKKPNYVLTWGQLKELMETAKVPDDAALFADEGDECDEGRFVEVSLGYIFPETATQDVAVVLALGQNWETEYDLQSRLNAHIDWTDEYDETRRPLAIDRFLQTRFSEKRARIRDLEKSLAYFEANETRSTFEAVRMAYALQWVDHPDFRKEWFRNPDA